MSDPQDGRLRRLSDLLSYPRESLDTEIKCWVDLAQPSDAALLAKAILALANHGGGHIIIGLSEESGVWRPAEERPGDLGGYDQDRANAIVQHYADPPFHCEVHHIPHPESGELFPVIVVPGGHPVPVRARRDGPNGKYVHRHAYYIRRPGPRSETPQTAREWDQLIRRCMAVDREGLLDSIRAILAGAQPTQRGALPEDTLSSRLAAWTREARSSFQERVLEELVDEQPSRYEHGTWDAAYALADVNKDVSPKELLAILDEVRGHETGWPPWWVPTREAIAARPYHGIVECWLKDTHFHDVATSDFWRGSPKGMMFLLRGYEEDGGDSRCEAGAVLDPVTAVWRAGECLLHAGRFAVVLADEATPILFRMQWRGLKGRQIRWIAGRAFGHWHSEHTCHQDAVDAEVLTRSSAIPDALPELVGALVRPLCEAFQFYELPQRIIIEQLAQMRGRA